MDRAQSNKNALRETEENSRNRAARKLAPNFPKPVSDRSTQRHADWPAELHAHEILTDRASILNRQVLQRVPYNFAPCRRAVENDRRSCLADPYKRLHYIGPVGTIIGQVFEMKM